MRDVEQATGKDLLPTHLLPGADGEGKIAGGLKGMSGIKVRRSARGEAGACGGKELCSLVGVIPYPSC